MRITVVGSGYVGLVAGACFADLGHEVILVDNNQEKLAALKAGRSPIHEQFLPELLERHRGKNLTFRMIFVAPSKRARPFSSQWARLRRSRGKLTFLMWSR